jgi:lipopolysaccharide export LptBFGC system permease protein LptF
MLDRYILRTFLFNYLVALISLICLYVVLDLFVNFDEFTERGKLPLQVARDIADYYGYNLPLYFSQLSGVITAFAACITLARLHRLNEITAMLASGCSMYRVATPVILAGLFMNALLIVDNEVILPNVAAKVARHRDDVEGTRAYGIWCVRDGPGRLITAQRFSPKDGRIRRMIIMELSTEPATRGRLGDVILADKATWVQEDDRRGWLLEGGRRVRVEQAWKGGLRGMGTLELEPQAFYAANLAPEELLLRQTTQWMQFLSISQLNELQQRGVANPAQVAKIKHGRFTLPISNMIMLLLGISFFMHRLPGSVLNQGTKALAMTASAFIIVFVGQQVVGAASPTLLALPAWLPIFLFGPVAVVLLDRVKT